MRQKIHNVLAVVLLTGIVCGSLTGCGGEYENTGRGKGSDAASGNAVSGTAVTDAERTKTQSHLFCTDTNLYYETYADEEDESQTVFQVRLDGTNRKKLFTEKDYEYLLGISDGWLYSIGDNQKKSGVAIYRMPIEKDSEGYDVVKKDEKELVVQEQTERGLYFLSMDSQYMFYILQPGTEGGADQLVKYDLEEEKEVYRQDYFAKDKVASDPISIRRIGEQYILFDAINDKVYAQPADGDEWEKISDISVYPDYLAQDESLLYYVSGHLGGISGGSIYVYDGEKETRILNKEQLRQVVAEGVGMNGKTGAIDICDITHLFAWNGRVYAQIEAGWDENNSYHMQYLIISRGEDETNFRYEQRMTECMNACGQTRTGVWRTDSEEPEKIEILKDHVVLNDAQCIQVVDGRAYVSGYDYREDEGRLYCYDLESGAVQEVKKNDVLFYALYFDGSNEYFEEVFEDNGTNDYVDYCCIPFFDKEEEGDFYETETE